MDDLDEFLDSAAVKVEPTSTGESAVSLTDKDDDFLAFLDAPVTSTPVATRVSTTGQYSVDTKPLDDSQDFLEWLQDSPRTQKKTLPSADVEVETRTPWSPNASFIETSKHLHREIKDTSKESMDSFFNEVFGSPNQSTKSGKGGDAGAGEDVGTGTETYEEKVQVIVQSSFPDVQQLRKVVGEAGFVPAAWRAQVWSLLLNEACVEDEEARHYNAEGAVFEGHELLASDCAAVISSNNGNLSAEAAEAARRDMIDVLALYCQRRSVPYTPVLCRLLSPLVAVPGRASRTVASSCFYTVATSFVPLMNLPPVAQQVGVGVSHRLLRLLLSYHAPALVQHLDRVLPHWQEPAADISAHQSVKIAAVHKRSSELDELERELGLDVLDDSLASAHRGEGDGKEIESALPTREGAGKGGPSAHHSRSNSGASALSMSGHGGAPAGRGCVPSHWIPGICSGSVPPAQAALLMDWAILSDSPYAGLYLSVALLVVYSHALLKLPGARIRQWFEEVGMNKADWYRNLSASVPEGVEKSVKVGGEVKFIPDDWTAFTKGWIHCATALIRSTPQSFKTVVRNTAEWATLKAEQRAARAHQRQQQLDERGIAGRGSREGSAHNASGLGSDLSLQEPVGDYTDSSAGTFDSPHTPMEEGSQGHATLPTGKSSLMSQFRRLSLHFQHENASSGPVVSPFARLYSFPHEKLHAGDPSAPLCIAADADEVIPCICSNRRRAVVPEDLVQVFYAAAFSSSSADLPSVFPQPALENQVFYFGIDCRTVEERRVGQFPKAYAFDPAGLADGDEVTKLLDMVGTMAASAHLCLIGAGDEFVRWSFEQAHSQQARRFSSMGSLGGGSSQRLKADSAELTRAIEEGSARLNAVAMFFLKKGFQHVSILNGGFIAAAKYLQQPDSPLTLTAALVDSDRPSLESLLGIPPSAASSAAAHPAKRESLVSFLAESTAVAPSKLLSVGGYFSGKSGSGSADAVGASAGRSASPVPQSAASSASVAATAPSGAAPTAGTTSTTSSNPAPASATAHPAEEAGESGTKQLLSSWGKKLTMFSTSSLESIKKVASTAIAVTADIAAPAPPLTAASAQPAPSSEEPEGDDGMGPRELPDTTGVSISRTDKEREQALSQHKMAGLRKGDTVMINRQDLPGAILFPSIKYKEVWVDEAAATSAADGTATPSEQPSAGDQAATSGTGGGAPAKVAKQVQVHRYLVVSRERFIVLDASGGGVGSAATVKSNRHLTELIKMTFKKKDPELVTLYFVSPQSPQGKARQYRVSKRQEFVTALQKNMERFK